MCMSKTNVFVSILEYRKVDNLNVFYFPFLHFVRNLCYKPDLRLVKQITNQCLLLIYQRMQLLRTKNKLFKKCEIQIRVKTKASSSL